MKTFGRGEKREPRKLELFKDTFEEEEEEEEIDKTLPKTETKRKKITDFFQCTPKAGKFPKTSILPSPTSQETGKQSKSSLSQTFLDLGQRNLFSTTCRECRFVYDPSFPSDRNLHKKQHARYMKPFQSQQYQSLFEWTGIFKETSHRIVRISFDPVLFKLIEMIGDWMEAAPLEPHDLEPMKFLFYCNEKNTIISALFYKLHKTSNMTTRPLCTIERIWTHCKHRRRGLATRLLKSIRICKHRNNRDCAKTGEECLVTKSQIVFGETTTLGSHLERSFLNQHNTKAS